MSYATQTVLWVIALASAGNAIGLAVRAFVRRGKESQSHE